MAAKSFLDCAPNGFSMEYTKDMDEKMELVQQFQKKLQNFSNELPPNEKEYMKALCDTLSWSVKNGSLDKLFGADDPLLKLVKEKLVEEEKRMRVQGLGWMTFPAITLLAGNPKLDIVEQG